MKKKKLKSPWLHMNFFQRWRELQKSADPQIREIAEAAGRYPDKARHVLEVLFSPYKDPPKKGGAPKKWGQTETLLAWLAVEVQVQLKSDNSPRAGVEPTMKTFFAKINRVPLGYGLYLETFPHLKIETPGLARHWHHEGEKILRKSPQLDKAWREILACELVHWRPVARKLTAK
jgi:hypothetical protein